MGTPHGSDIVVVYRTYTVTNLFGGKVSKVNCKSLIDGETFDLTIDNNCMSAQLYELNRAQNLNDAGVNESRRFFVTWSPITYICTYIPPILSWSSHRAYHIYLPACA